MQFVRQKLYEDVSRAGISGCSSRLGPLKLRQLHFSLFSKKKKKGEEEEDNLQPEGDPGTLQVSSPHLGSPPLLGTVKHTLPAAMGGRQRAGWQLWKSDKEQSAA